MKKLFCILFLFAGTVAAFGQGSGIPQILDIVEVENENGRGDLEIFNMPANGVNHYFLSVGNLGMGDDIVQLNFDPLYVLFIPLGDTLEESAATIQKIQDLFKNARGTSFQIQGNFAAGIPGDRLEPVTITYRRILLGKALEFSLQRDGYLRATYVSKSNFSNLNRGLKLYRKLHQKEL